MAALEEIVNALAAGGMDPIAAARLVMRAVVEETSPTRSKAALRTQRWRDRRAAETVTERHNVTVPELPLGPSQSVTKRHSVTVPLSKKDIGRSPASQVTRKRTSLPVGFLLSEKMRSHALSKGLDPPRIAREFERFCDNHRAKGSLFADWEAAWRTWVSHSIEFARKNGGGQGGGYRWNGGIEGVT